MSWKLKMLVGLGAGYVLGARAGRERYDQIASRAQKMWHDPRVQEKAEDARQAAGIAAEQAGGSVVDKAAQAQEAVKEQAARATAAMKEKVGNDHTGSGSNDSEAGSTTSDDSTNAAPPSLDADMRAMGAAPVTPGQATAPRTAPGSGPGSGAAPSAPGEFEDPGPSGSRP